MIQVSATEGLRRFHATREAFGFPEGELTPETVVTLWGFSNNVRIWNLDADGVYLEALPFISAQYAEEKVVLPVCINGNELFVAMVNPTDGKLISELATKTGKRIVPVVLLHGGLPRIAEKYYKGATTSS